MHATLFRRPSSTDGAATPHLLFLMERQLSLSRLHHWLPRGQTHPDVVQGTAECHHQSADAFFPEAEAVFDNATTLDPAVDMLKPQPTLGQRLVRPMLRQREILAAWLLGRHEALDLRARAGQEAQILSQPAASRAGLQGGRGHPLVMAATAVAPTAQEAREEGMAQEDIVHCMVFFLAAITCRLCRRVLGADDPPLGAVRGTRGDTGAVTKGTGSSSRGAPTVAASASETPSRCARAVRERAGASPRARSAARNAGRSTCIH
jgi:hypothetical protein